MVLELLRGMFAKTVHVSEFSLCFMYGEVLNNNRLALNLLFVGLKFHSSELGTLRSRRNSNKGHR